MKKIFFIFIFALLHHPSAAFGTESYFIRINIVSPKKETISKDCTLKIDRCIAVFNFVEHKSLNAIIGIKNDYAEFEFSDDQKLMVLSDQGLSNSTDSFIRLPMDEPKIIKLYAPSQEALLDQNNPSVAVIRPPNKLVYEVEISITQN